MGIVFPMRQGLQSGKQKHDHDDYILELNNEYPSLLFGRIKIYSC